MNEAQSIASTQGSTAPDPVVGRTAVDRDLIDINVDYLPAREPFVRKYKDETTLEAVRTDAMNFFGVRDYQDRNIHKFYLEFEGRVLENTAETLEQLLGPHQRAGRFNLIERVTQG